MWNLFQKQAEVKSDITEIQELYLRCLTSLLFTAGIEIMNQQPTQMTLVLSTLKQLVLNDAVSKYVPSLITFLDIGREWKDIIPTLL